MSVAHDPAIETDAPIPTWFGVGGRADALARPRSVEELRALLRRFDRVRVLGDGANMLVDDDGVDGLVVSLENLRRVERPDPNDPGLLRVGAGANLPRLIVDTVRDGLSGLEGLAGVPASLGGAIVMNAGGAFGEIAQAVERVRALTLDGEEIVRTRDEIPFGYRSSGLRDLIVVEADLRLTPAEDAAALRSRMKEVMSYKKGSQPMGERSAGCAFKNPTLPTGERVSAGMLIDRAGCKGERVGGARVSDVHANFIVVDTAPGACTARDVVALMRRVRARVLDHAGVTLEPEVAIWRRADQPGDDPLAEAKP
ncbi:MAG: UDP-N-acetylmuramate dehydrogenase [Phycisphaerales bacterium]|nr:MAG: UDP-N-acetylmuramate dehydrogenase [Phycisphaerales bacterium]